MTYELCHILIRVIEINDISPQKREVQVTVVYFGKVCEHTHTKPQLSLWTDNRIALPGPDQ